MKVETPGRSLENTLFEVLDAGSRGGAAMGDLLALLSLVNLMGIINLMSGREEVEGVLDRAVNKRSPMNPDPAALLNILSGLAVNKNPGPGSPGAEPEPGQPGEKINQANK